MFAVMLYDGMDAPMGLACKDDDSGDTATFDTEKEAEEHGKEVSAWSYKVIEI